MTLKNSSRQRSKEGHVKKGKRGQFILIAILLVAVMMISIMVGMYGTVTYYRYESWEEYIGMVENVKTCSQQILRKGLADFTKNFYERGIVDKNSTSAILDQWTTDLREALPGYGLDLNFDKGSRLLTIGSYSRSVDDIIKCYWNYPEGLSSIYAEIRLNISEQGLYGYETEDLLYLHAKADISYKDLSLPQITNLNVTVDREGAENGLPVVDLTKANFNALRFNSTLGDWTFVNVTNALQTNAGTYMLTFANPIEAPYHKWLQITVKDTRGIYVNLATYSYIEFKVQRTAFPSSRTSSADEIYTLESDIGGHWYWNGKMLNISSESGPPVMPPIPQIPTKQFRVNVTETGVNGAYVVSPCQYEIWDKQTWHGQEIQVPRGLADPQAKINASNRVVFQVKFPQLSISEQKVRIYWLDDLDAEPYQGPSDLSYDPNNLIANTNKYKVEFIGVGHTSSPMYRYPNGTLRDYYGVAALLMIDPSTDLCFGPWNLHAFGKDGNYLAEWRPYGQWQIKYWYGSSGKRAVVRLIAILNSTEVQCVYQQSHHSSSYYDTFAFVFITANVKYLQENVYVYWKQNQTDNGLWFASVMGNGGPVNYAFLDYTTNTTSGPYTYDYQAHHHEYTYPSYWAAHWNSQFGRGLVLNERSVQSLRSIDPSRTRFSVTDSAPGGANQGSIEFEAVNCAGNEYTAASGRNYNYTLAMWMYSGGTQTNGYYEIRDNYYMFREPYAPKIILPEG
jgi:hypothetical protein